MARSPAGAGRRHPEGSRRRQPVVVHRRRRLQRHAQFGPLPDQPEAARAAAPRPRAQIIRRLQQETAEVAGIALYMQPVQDLTIDTTVSATQYQFMLETPIWPSSRTWVPQADRRGCRQIREITDVASDLQQSGLSAYIDDRPRHRGALRHHAGDRRQRALRRVRPADHLDDLHPVEPVPRHPRGRSGAAAARSTRSASIYLPSSAATAGQVPLSAIATVASSSRRCRSSHLGQFPATTISFNLAPGASLGAAVDAIKQAERDIGLPASFTTAFQGAALGVPGVAVERALLLLAAVVDDVYRARRALRELHPSRSRSSRPCPRRASARCSR